MSLPRPTSSPARRLPPGPPIAESSSNAAGNAVLDPAPAAKGAGFPYNRRMSKSRDRGAIKAYLNEFFLRSSDARPLRILSEYLEPESRLAHYRIEDTIVFVGSARLVAREQAEAELRAAEAGGGDPGRARIRLEMSRYYED